jgi:hypothetical protein
MTAGPAAGEDRDAVAAAVAEARAETADRRRYSVVKPLIDHHPWGDDHRWLHLPESLRIRWFGLPADEHVGVWQRLVAPLVAPGARSPVAARAVPDHRHGPDVHVVDDGLFDLWFSLDTTDPRREVVRLLHLARRPGGAVTDRPAPPVVPTTVYHLCGVRNWRPAVYGGGPGSAGSLRADVRARGWPDAAVERLVGNVVPVVRLRPLPNRAGPGRSRFGGSPDLPPDVPWPTVDGVPATFLAQLDLAELPDVPLAAELPRSGLLSFFWDEDYVPLDDGTGLVVLHLTDVPALERREAPVSEPPVRLPGQWRWRALPETGVRMEPEVVLPDDREQELAFDDVGAGADDVLLSVVDGGSRLLGPVGDDALPWFDVDDGAPAPDWLPLLRLADEHPFTVEISSRRGPLAQAHLDVWIRGADLRAGRFDRCRHTVDLV